MATTPKPAEKAAPIDTSKGLTVLAARTMYRAGCKWSEGATDLTAEQATELGQEKLQALAADTNFALAAIGTKAVTIVGAEPDSEPVNAHTVVFGKKGMWRGGRFWNAGATPLSVDQVEELGKKLDAVRSDTTNFTVTQVPKDAATGNGKKSADAK